MQAKFQSDLACWGYNILSKKKNAISFYLAFRKCSTTFLVLTFILEHSNAYIKSTTIKVYGTIFSAIRNFKNKQVRNPIKPFFALKFKILSKKKCI